jgi:peptidase M10/serralysin-like protein/VCBS repeat protein
MDPLQDQEITFISGVDDTGKVAATSYNAWNGDTPPTYAATSGEFKWGNTTIGTPGGNVNYYFDPASNWTTAEQNALASGLALWAAEVNISFTEVASAGAADFTFYRNTNDTAFENNNPTNAAIGGTTAPNPTGTYITIDTATFTGPIGGAFKLYGNFGYDTIVHEEGHVIGLGHAGPYNTTANVKTQQYSPYDSEAWSIMSYVSPDKTAAKYYDQYPVHTAWGTTTTAGSDWLNSPGTPMIDDILAAQQLYGAATSGPLTRAQTFGFNTTVTGLIRRYFDFTIDTVPIVTIYDTANNNTLDLSGWSDGETINLNPGTFSSADGMVNNIAIAYGTDVNNAVGGSGDDRFIVNPNLSGVLTGGGGNDTFQGTESGLSHYTITDLNVGDKLNFTDGDPTTFSYARNGDSLQYDGMSLTMSNDPVGHFATSDNASTGGINLTLDKPTSTSDFSDDGRSDILWRGSDGTLADWSMTSTTITSSRTLNASPDASWSILTTGDFNGDGHSDILWQDTDRTLIDWSMNGTSILSTQTLSAAPDASWSLVADADFDGDGTADLLWRKLDGSLVDWSMNGGTIGSSQTLNVAPDASWSIAGTGDFNGDGRADILWRQSGTGLLSIWNMNGAAIASAQDLNVAPDSSWSVAGIGDFDGDGNDDILWRNNTTGELDEWLMNGSTITSTQTINVSPDSSWSIVEVGDFNGNGRSDLLWRQSSIGELAIWQMNGATIGLAQNLSAAPDSTWQTEAHPTSATI